MTTICQFCGNMHGVRCPEVRAIDYYEDGTVKRVEFVRASDYMPPLAPAWPSSPTPTAPWDVVGYWPPTVGMSVAADLSTICRN